MITKEVWNIVSQESFDKWVPQLEEQLAASSINTKSRICMFLAQASHESGGFARLEENLRYSDPARIALIFRSGFDLDKDRVVDPEEIEFAKAYVKQPAKLANRAYANRMGNGNEMSGDGYLYRGRGIFQLTGKNNYSALFFSLGLKNNPDLLLTPKYAIMSAIWFWNSRNLNKFADSNDIKGSTVAINGGTHGLVERTNLFNKLKVAMK